MTDPFDPPVYPDEYVVDYEKLKNFRTHYTDPWIEFDGLKVAMTTRENMTVQGDKDHSYDEQVTIVFHGTRGFGGIVFKSSDIVISDCRLFHANNYFKQIAHIIINDFAKKMCACGGIAQCFCKKVESTNG